MEKSVSLSFSMPLGDAILLREKLAILIEEAKKSNGQKNAKASGKTTQKSGSTSKKSGKK